MKRLWHTKSHGEIKIGRPRETYRHRDKKRVRYTEIGSEMEREIDENRKVVWKEIKINMEMQLKKNTKVEIQIMILIKEEKQDHKDIVRVA